MPAGLTLEQAEELRRENPEEYVRRSRRSMATQVRAMLEMMRRGAVVFDYGNNIRQVAKDEGVDDAFAYPGFVPAYIRPLFCEGKGPFRWVALSGDPADIHVTDEVILNEFAHDEHLTRWIRMAHDHVAFQGLPARICWLGYGERARFGKIINDLVAAGKISAPIVIGRDHLDCGSVASPNRETGDEGRVGRHRGLARAERAPKRGERRHVGELPPRRRVGIGYSLHAGMVIVADGTAGRGAARAGADRGPGDRGGPARGCRIRGGAGVRREARDQDSESRLESFSRVLVGRLQPSLSAPGFAFGRCEHAV